MPIILGPHAVFLDRDHILCSCPEHGCNEVVIEFNGAIHKGRRIHRKSYQLHLEKAQMKAPLPSQSTIQTSIGNLAAPILATSSDVSFLFLPKSFYLTNISRSGIRPAD